MQWFGGKHRKIALLECGWKAYRLPPYRYGMSHNYLQSHRHG
jgi:hypothetical protein